MIWNTTRQKWPDSAWLPRAWSWLTSMAVLRAKGLQGIIKKDPFLSQRGKKCGFCLGTRQSCKSLDTFLFLKNLTYNFAVETRFVNDEYLTERSFWVQLMLFTKSCHETGLTGWKKCCGVIEQKERICLIARPTQILFEQQICQWLFPLLIMSRRYLTVGGLLALHY